MVPEFSAGGGPVIADDLFRRFCSVIHEATGLSFNEGSRFFLEKRLETRMAARQVPSAAAYLQFLLYDAEREREWESLIGVITTNETYFMREERQLRCFQKDIIPVLLDRSEGRRIRIWSAGCSSGEEAYTIGILIREAVANPSQFEIFGTDINAKVLQRAKEGIYGEHSFRVSDPTFKKRWFLPAGPGQYRVLEDLRKMVTFSRFNLFDTDRYAFLSPFDLIFCRNVIIYFDTEAKVKVVERFHDKLKPGGFILLGHSESLITITEKFRLIHLPHDLVYVKEEP